MLKNATKSPGHKGSLRYYVKCLFLVFLSVFVSWWQENNIIKTH